MKSPSSTSTSMKHKTLLHTLILSLMCRVAPALSKAKSILIQILKEIQFIHLKKKKKNNNKSKSKSKSKKKIKLFAGSFRLHYNWCSSHVVPVSTPVRDGLSTSHMYYDFTWNSIISTNCDDISESQLSGYLHWLEEKVHDNCTTDHVNEIDQLADLFIASCHEKFRLEKQESYRRFQEMMARSV